MGFDLLAFGAHPDDVEITCGALVHKMAASGYRVAICDFTRGEMGTRGDVATRAREAEEARRILGVEARVNLGLPDTAVNRQDRAHLSAVVEVLRQFKPRLVIAPYGVDQHPDHEEASALVTRATFVAGLARFETPTMDRHRPVTTVYSMYRRPFDAHFIVDVSDSFDVKMEAVRAHRSQVFADPEDPNPTRLTSPDFLQSLVARGQFYGSRIGVKYGEPYMSREELSVSDPVAAFAGVRSGRLLG